MNKRGSLPDKNLIWHENGMIYLILADTSSMLVSVIMRVSEKHIHNNITMLASNYLMCSVLAAICTGT